MYNNYDKRNILLNKLTRIEIDAKKQKKQKTIKILKEKISENAM